MHHIGAQVDDDFYKALLQVCRIEERAVSSFIRIAIKDKVLELQHRYGLNG